MSRGATVFPRFPFGAGRTHFFLLLAVAPLITAAPRNPPMLGVTPAPAGPYRVDGNALLDSTGHGYLIRGTRLAILSAKRSDISGTATTFGSLSPTTLITIRQRLNMNAVRLPVLPEEYGRDPAYREQAQEVVRTANWLELLVILEAEAPDIGANTLLDFWSRCAADFRDNPDVLFAISPDLNLAQIPGHAGGVPLSSDWRFWRDGGAMSDGRRFAGMQAFVSAIRATGADQPIITGGLQNQGLTGLTADFEIRDPKIVYEATAHYSTIRTDRDRRAQFGLMAERVPVLVNDFDPQLNVDSAECRQFPDDPADASRIVEDNLNYLDSHAISWTLSSFQPGKLTTDYRFYNGTKLDDGWTCREPHNITVGLGMLLLTHLWGAADTHGLFAVNGTRGGLVLSRGGITNAYGPILAERDIHADKLPLPLALGNVSVRVTDSRGVARFARLSHTGAGWTQLTFIVPASSAPGPAKIEIVRLDGSSSAAKAIIEDVAPGLFTLGADGRGPAVGEVEQRFRDGRKKTFPVARCTGGDCSTVPIPLSSQISTKVRLVGSGFRYAGPKPDVHAWIGRVPIPVVSLGPEGGPGADQLTIAVPHELAGLGETDLVFTVNGALSNVVRINCGSSQ